MRAAGVAPIELRGDGAQVHPRFGAAVADSAGKCKKYVLAETNSQIGCFLD